MLILLFLFTKFALGSLTFLNTTTGPHKSSNYKISEIATQKQFLINYELLADPFQSFSECYINYYTLNSTMVSYYFTLNYNDLLPEIRSTPLTTSPKNSTFLTFTPLQVLVHRNFNSSLQLSFDFSMFGYYNVHDACVGSNLNEIYVLIRVYPGSLQTYSILIFNNSATYQTLKNITVSSSPYDGMMCINNKIYVSFLNQILILSMNRTLNFVSSIPCLAGSTALFDFHVRGDLLAYNNATMLTVMNMTDGSILGKNSILGKGSFIRFLSDRVVVYVNTTHLMQYDFINKVNMSSSILTSGGYNHMIYIIDKFIVTTIDILEYPYSPSNIDYHTFNLNYSCAGCSNCSTGYILDPISSTCIPSNTTVKPSNNTANITTNSTNTNTTNTTTVNSTNNTNANVTNNTNNTNHNVTNTTNKSVNINTLPSDLNTSSKTITQRSNSSPNIQIENDISGFFMKLDTKESKPVSQTMSSVMIISSMKFSPQFFLSLSLFLDDISYYSYHTHVYPSSVRYFFDKAFAFLKDKLNPWLLQAIEVLNHPTSYALSSNRRNAALLALPSLATEEVVFTRSFVENYRNNILFTLFLFFMMLLIRLALQALKCCGFNFKRASHFVIRNTRWWLLYASLVEGNVSRICFDFGIQAQTPGSDTLLDRFNLVIAWTVGFMVLIQVFVFYAQVFCGTNRKGAKVVLMPCRYAAFSFVLQPVLMVGRTCLRSFLHSFLLGSHTHQIMLLTLIDLGAVMLCFRMRTLFYNRLVFVLYTFYMCFFAVFDLFFFLEQSGALPVDVMRELFGVTVLGAIIAVSVSIFLVFLFLILRVILRLILGYLFEKQENLEIIPLEQLNTKQTQSYEKIKHLKLAKAKNDFALWFEHGKINDIAPESNYPTPVVICAKIKNSMKKSKRQERKNFFKINKISHSKTSSNDQR